MAEDGDGNRKKRGAERQLTDRDNVDDEVDEDNDGGTWQKADDATLAKRRIVKVVRKAPSTEVPKAAINWSFMPTTGSTEQKEETHIPAKEEAGTPLKVEEEAIKQETKTNGTGKETSPVAEAKATPETPTETKAEHNPFLSPFPDFKFPPPAFSFNTLSSTPSPFPAFTGFNFPPSGFSPSGFSPSAIPSSFHSTSIFGKDIAAPKPREGVEEDGDDALPEEEVPIEPIAGKKMVEVNVTTGEEDEETLFKVTAKLYSFEVKTRDWKQRGSGQLKVNQSKTNPSQARLIMRDQGGKQLRLNIAIFPAMKVERTQRHSSIIVDTFERSADGKSTTAMYLLNVLGPKEDTDGLVTHIEKMKREVAKGAGKGSENSTETKKRESIEGAESKTESNEEGKEEKNQAEEEEEEGDESQKETK